MLLKSVFIFAISLFCLFRSVLFFKLNLSAFLKYNAGCELICPHPVAILDEQLAPIRSHLPKYKKVGFITDYDNKHKGEHWFSYRIARYLLYPSLLENSEDYDVLVGFFSEPPKLDKTFKSEIKLNNRIFVLKRVKNND